MREPFTLLLPVYAGDRPDYLRRAYRSAVDDQTVRPDQVVIVRDGPVGPGLATCLDEIRAASPVPVTLVTLTDNAGLGPALDRGLAASWFDVVARMDADDVAMPHRFEVELPLIADADIVGSGLLEFGADTDDILGQRVPPTGPGRIGSYARMHDPFNHPTVVYRRQAVVAAGGYGDLPLMEDYALFARMLQRGARAVNVAEPLVFYRVGTRAFKRRGGIRLLRSELALQREFRRRGFTSSVQCLRNVLVRGGYRLIPWWLRRAVYRPVVARYAGPEGQVPALLARPQPPRWEYADEWPGTETAQGWLRREPVTT
ncbi:MAG TPA: glycosyltransferase [Streptosporangiaceae bacterium]|jgi:glycosyltransferase involved in cell wall biosynthesis